MALGADFRLRVADTRVGRESRILDIFFQIFRPARELPHARAGLQRVTVVRKRCLWMVCNCPFALRPVQQVFYRKHIIFVRGGSLKSDHGPWATSGCRIRESWIFFRFFVQRASSRIHMRDCRVLLWCVNDVYGWFATVPSRCAPYNKF